MFNLILKTVLFLYETVQILYILYFKCISTPWWSFSYYIQRNANLIIYMKLWCKQKRCVENCKTTHWLVTADMSLCYIERKDERLNQVILNLRNVIVTCIFKAFSNCHAPSIFKLALQLSHKFLHPLFIIPSFRRTIRMDEIHCQALYRWKLYE